MRAQERYTPRRSFGLQDYIMYNYRLHEFLNGLIKLTKYFVKYSIF